MNQKETEIEPDLWDGHLVKLVHKKAIRCSVASSYANHLVRSSMLSSLYNAKTFSCLFG